MAYASHSDFSAGIRAQLDRFFATIGQGFNAYLEARSRRDEIERLSALSDAQLARMGLKRDQIVHHVFRDKLGL